MILRWCLVASPDGRVVGSFQWDLQETEPTERRAAPRVEAEPSSTSAAEDPLISRGTPKLQAD